MHQHRSLADGREGLCTKGTDHDAVGKIYGELEQAFEDGRPGEGNDGPVKAFFR